MDLINKFQKMEYIRNLTNKKDIFITATNHHDSKSSSTIKNAKQHSFPVQPFNCTNNLEFCYCKHCGTNFETITHWRKHIREKCLIEETKRVDPLNYTSTNYICRDCTFNTYSTLHWLKHVTDGCYLLVPDEPKLEDQNWFKCDQCTFKTMYKIIMSRHKSHKHTDRESKQSFRCGMCDYKATQKGNLKRHTFAKHTEDKHKKWFKCDKCLFRTVCKQTFQIHYCKKFKCNECNFETRWKHNLVKHKASKHGSDEERERCKCDKCEIERTHGICFFSKHCEKIFKCGDCNYETNWKKSLVKHKMAKHTDDKDKKWWKCDKCEYKTIHKFNLKAHLNLKHTNDEDKKWFKCDQCVYKTMYKKDLKIHFVAKHTDDANKIWFNCDKCTYKSIYKKSVNKHFVSKHAEGKHKNGLDSDNQNK